jgi:hypothetical protein
MSFSSRQRLDAISTSPDCSLRAKERSNLKALPGPCKLRIYRTFDPVVLNRIAETRLAGTVSLTERLIELTLWLERSAKDAGNQTGESVVKNPEPRSFTVSREVHWTDRPDSCQGRVEVNLRFELFG